MNSFNIHVAMVWPADFGDCFFNPQKQPFTSVLQKRCSREFLKFLKFRFHNSIEFSHKECTCLKKVIHQVDKKKMAASYTCFNKFYGKKAVGFCLNTGKSFFLEV